MGDLLILPFRAQNQPFNSMAGNSAQAVVTDYEDALDFDFLLKKIRAHVALSMTDGQESGGMLAFCAIGDVSVTELAGIIDSTYNEETAARNTMEQQGRFRNILWETVRGFKPLHESGSGSGMTSFSMDMSVSVGGKSGIPLKEGKGIQMCIYNGNVGALGTPNTVDLWQGNLYGVEL